MNAIEHLRDLGYTCGIAHGSVEVEVEARETAVLSTAPEKLTRQAGEVALQTVIEAQAIGASPPNGLTWPELTAKLAAQAYRMLEEGAEARINLHDRALEIAKSEPTVWHVSGFGLETYVGIDDLTGGGYDGAATQSLEELFSEEAHAERLFQFHAPPEVVQAVRTLRISGVEVEKAVWTGKGFEVKVAGSRLAKDEAAVATITAKHLNG